MSRPLIPHCVLRRLSCPEQNDCTVHLQILGAGDLHPAGLSGLSLRLMRLSHLEPPRRRPRDAPAFIGLRPWEGAEVFYAPELAQGFGLAKRGRKLFKWRSTKSGFCFPSL